MPSVIDLLSPYNISEDILAMKANATKTNQMNSVDISKMTVAKYYVQIGNKLVITTLDTGAAKENLRKSKGSGNYPTGRKARIHFDKRRIFLNYQGNELEIPISHYKIKGLARPDESEAGEYKSGDTFNESEYKSKEVEEEEKYYIGEQSEGKEVMREEIPSPAVYLTTLEEVLTPEDEEEPAIKKPQVGSRQSDGKRMNESNKTL
ncbi:16663_t:CDS:2 [Acaulospora morrowiae]|uniref:16663_t:CDS:1 n=1 Tax=Acaulospora morrowiae TaxID=94023 RepID=A0A9N9BFZ8_9GLOM|nr:16663_t:CDS:2 [Acaulospora morrowiae]